MSNLFNLIRIEFGETLREQEEILTLNGFGRCSTIAAERSGSDVAGFAPTTSAACLNNSSLQRKESTIAEHLFAAHKAATKKMCLVISNNSINCCQAAPLMYYTKAPPRKSFSRRFFCIFPIYFSLESFPSNSFIISWTPDGTSSAIENGQGLVFLTTDWGGMTILGVGNGTSTTLLISTQRPLHSTM